MRIVWLTVLLVIVVVVLVVYYGPKIQVPEEKAVNFVMDDLANKYPGGDYSILSMELKKSDKGENYYDIKAKATIGLDTPCPKRIHVYYNYPEQGFVVHPPDVVTDNCLYCTNQPNCIIMFDEEAIIASHTIGGTEAVTAYISEFDAQPKVSFDDANDVWTVTWDSPAADRTVTVKISSGNALESVEQAEK